MADSPPMDVPATKRRKARSKGALARRAPRRPITARLALSDDGLRRGGAHKDDIGIISEDLVRDLFPGAIKSWRDADPTIPKQDLIVHVAITPSSPLANDIDESTWTILPVKIAPPAAPGSAVAYESSATSKVMANLPHATIQFPSNSFALQSFHQSLEILDPGRRAVHGQKPVEIRILDVVPLHLDSIYVTVEKHMLRDLDEVQKKFGGGFNSHSGNNNANTKLKGRDAKAAYKMNAEERLRTAVRESLAKSAVIHEGDVLNLPLPAHPITHVPPPPARVSFCQPVSQGLLMPKTKIIVVQARSAQARGLKSMQTITTGRHARKSSTVDEEADDTSNEQFYSAAEDRNAEDTTDLETTTTDQDSETDVSSVHSGGSDVSDDSLDDMISMSAPGLPPQASGTLSGMTSATPRPGFGRRLDGIHTPGSVFSSFTSTTQRPGGRSAGKVFKADEMLKRIPTEALHPKPREDDDEDAIVFVDIHTLVKIGCFSGDWVKIEPAKEPQANPFAMLNFGLGFGHSALDEDANEWRAVKVYGLPGLTPNKPRYAMNRSIDRRSSVSQLGHMPLAPTVLVPPILHANLASSKYLRLSPLPAPQGGNNSAIGMAPPRGGLTQSKTAATSTSLSPPVAKEVNLIKLLTPLSIDLSLQQSLFAGLKRYFESRRRVVKTGDLIGISIDVGLGKTVFTPSSNPNPDPTAAAEDEDLTSKLGFSHDAESGFSMGASGSSKRKIGAAWFRIGSVVPVSSGDGEGGNEENDNDRWGGVAVIDPASTKTMQSRQETGRIPGALDSNWEYWLGVRNVPRLNQEIQPKSFVVETPKTYASSLQGRLRDLIAAATSPRAISLGMKPVVVLLTSTQRNIGKASVAQRACADIGVHTFTIDGYDILAESGAAGGDVNTAGYFSARVDRAMLCGSASTALVIRHVETLTADRMVTAFKDTLSDLRVVIATTTDVDKIPEGMRGMFTHEMDMTAPDEKEREGILINAVAEQRLRLAPDVDLGSVALKTAALVAGDLVDVVERATAAKVARLDRVVEDARQLYDNKDDEASTTTVATIDVQLSGGSAIRCVTKSDFTTAIDAARKNFADSIGAPKIPNVTWDDVGGLTHIKDAVMETIQLPLERPELFAKGMKKRSGILFYGPPGTGKTLLAKAIATEFSLNFFSVKGPELLNMYIGESEANVRRVFQRARDARPCCVFFDELDSVAPKRGNQGDSGGVMDRIVSQLLAELDGMSGDSGSGDGDDDDSGSGGGGVFVIGATNRPDLLDPALLRPGRFDKMLYLGVSDTHEKQATILTALTRKFSMHPTVSLPRVAETLPFTYTGADLYALCSDAMLKAVTRKAEDVDEKIKLLEQDRGSGPGSISTAWWFDHVAKEEDVAVQVQEEDFVAARKELVASVSAKELEHFERIRRMFETTDDSKPKPPQPQSQQQRPSPAPLAIRSSSTSSRHHSYNSHKSRTGSGAGGSIKGKGKGKGRSSRATASGTLSSDGEPDDSDAYDNDAPNGLGLSLDGVANGHGHHHDEDDDDYVIKTDYLAGSTGSLPPGSGSRDGGVSPGGTNWSSVWSKGKGPSRKGKGGGGVIGGFEEGDLEEEEGMYE